MLFDIGFPRPKGLRDVIDFEVVPLEKEAFNRSPVNVERERRRRRRRESRGAVDQLLFCPSCVRFLDASFSFSGRSGD